MVCIVTGTEEIQPVGGKGRRCTFASARRQHLGHPVARPGAGPHGDQAAHEVADHVVQEGHRLEVEAPVRPMALDGDLAHQLDRRQRLAVGRPEGGKIVLADQVGGGAAHGLDLQRAERPAHRAPVDRRFDGRFDDDVGVTPTSGEVARMEVVCHWHTPLDRDVARQVAVGAADPGERVTGAVGVEVDDLIEAVDTGVGAASAHGLDGRHRELGERLFQVVLNRAAVWLALPAVVSGAAVGDA